MTIRSKRATYEQLSLPFPQPMYDLCSKCGQPILTAPPEDPLGEAILRVLYAAGGKLVKMQLILDFVGMKVSRATVHRRLKVYEANEYQWVEREKEQHPKMGYRITEAGRRRISVMFDLDHEHTRQQAAA